MPNAFVRCGSRCCRAGNFFEITDLGCCCCRRRWQQQLQLAKFHSLGYLAVALALTLTSAVAVALATLFAAIRLALAAGPQNFELLRRRLQTCAGFQFVVVIKGRTAADGHANNVYKHSCCCCWGCRCIAATATVACADRATFTSPKGWRHFFFFFFCAPLALCAAFGQMRRLADPDIHVCDTLNSPAGQTRPDQSRLGPLALPRN